MSLPGSAEPPAAATSLEPGSFRDWDSRVFYDDGRVLRALSDDGLQDWIALSESKLFAEAVAEGKLVATSRVDDRRSRMRPPCSSTSAFPFVSYPYEWTFAMLRDAALLQLELLRRALDEDLILKDSSSYNVQWRGARPVFIDVGSFERLRAGRALGGLPPVLHALPQPAPAAGVQGSRLQAVASRQPRRASRPSRRGGCLSSRDLFRRGVMTNVALHARLERKHGRFGARREDRAEARGLQEGADRRERRRLDKLVRGLEWEPGPTEWSGYSATTSYDEADAARKEEFVREVVQTREWSLVWDIGCNEGRHSRIAAENARYVVALDGDPAVVDRLYRSLAAEGSTTILPLVADVTDPSPALGWQGLERKTLDARGRPELTLCLAVAAPRGDQRQRARARVPFVARGARARRS